MLNITYQVILHCGQDQIRIGDRFRPKGVKSGH